MLQIVKNYYIFNEKQEFIEYTVHIRIAFMNFIR